MTALGRLRQRRDREHRDRERLALVDAIQADGGNMTAMAKRLGCAWPTVASKIGALGLRELLEMVRRERREGAP